MNHNLQREQRNQQQQQQYNRGGPLHPGGEGGERINRDAQRRVDQPPQQHHRDNENRLPQRENDLINLHAERINRDDVVNEVHENVEMDVEDDDDDDEEEEDDEDEDDEDEDDEDDEDEENGNNSAIEGGVVMGEEGKNQLATSCNMYVYIECAEKLPPSLVPVPNHPVYSPGIKVVIGMEKTTRLSAVFARYCEVANAHPISPQHIHLPKVQVDPADLEFSHCSILSPRETAETSALMKNDVIYVRRSRMKERRAQAEWKKAQNDSDREYFNQMRNLMPDKMPLQLKCNVVFHCRGRMKDENGYEQRVLTTLVKGHEQILSKRCEWLKLKIEAAKREFESTNNGRGRRRVGLRGEDFQAVEDDRMFDAQQGGMMMRMRVNDGRNGNAIPVDDDYYLDGNPSGIRLANDVDLEENENVQRIDNAQENPMRRLANAVEDDDEDENDNGDGFNRRMNMGIHNIQDLSADESGGAVSRDDGDMERNSMEHDGDHDDAFLDRAHDHEESSPVIPYVGGSFPDTLRVVLSHPPEAVKLLLEYCYTNRVIALGQLAFEKSYIPLDRRVVDPLIVDYCGPVSPFPNPRGVRSPWPEDTLKKPTVSLPVALAGIQLAEEAKLPRLSLMCEIAASQLVTDSTALEALVSCEQQYKLTGNRLPHLRKAVMLHHVLGYGPKGVEKLASMASFNKTLREKYEDAVPSLMMGILETLKSLKGDKEDPNDYDEIREGRKRSTDLRFQLIDEGDSLNRGKERLRWRRERWSKRPRNFEEGRNPYGLEEIDADRSVIETEKQRPFEEGPMMDCNFLSKSDLRHHRLRVKYPTCGSSSGRGRSSSRKHR